MNALHGLVILKKCLHFDHEIALLYIPEPFCSRLHFPDLSRARSLIRRTRSRTEHVAPSFLSSLPLYLFCNEKSGGISLHSHPSEKTRELVQFDIDAFSCCAGSFAVHCIFISDVSISNFGWSKLHHSQKRKGHLI